MGDPRKNRKKFTRPKQGFNKQRIEEEKGLKHEFGIRRKSEFYRTESLLRKFGAQAKTLMSSSTAQSEQEQKALLAKLQAVGLLAADAKLDNILALNLKDLLERRLQTQLVRKGFANTMKQARQFIVHGHIKVNKKIITSPSYLVSKAEEATISFAENSSIADPMHPERPEQIFKMKETRKAPKVEEVKEEVKTAPLIVKAEHKEVKTE